MVNGAHKFPGAVAVEDPSTGKVISLQSCSEAVRQSMAKQLLTQSGSGGRRASRKAGSLVGRDPDSAASTGGKIVYRHLLDGDVLLTNRQPTLHKPGAPLLACAATCIRCYMRALLCVCDAPGRRPSRTWTGW